MRLDNYNNVFSRHHKTRELGIRESTTTRSLVRQEGATFAFLVADTSLKHSSSTGELRVKESNTSPAPHWLVRRSLLFVDSLLKSSLGETVLVSERKSIRAKVRSNQSITSFVRSIPQKRTIRSKARTHRYRHLDITGCHSSTKQKYQCFGARAHLIMRYHMLLYRNKT